VWWGTRRKVAGKQRTPLEKEPLAVQQTSLKFFNNTEIRFYFVLLMKLRPLTFRKQRATPTSIIIFSVLLISFDFFATKFWECVQSKTRMEEKNGRPIQGEREKDRQSCNVYCISLHIVPSLFARSDKLHYNFFD